MANRLFLQTILKFSDKIKDGSVRITDIVDDYFRTSGKAPTEEESAILLKEFQDNAPSNVTTLEGVDPRETIMPTGIDSTSLKDNLMKTDNPFSDLVKTTEEGPKTLDQRRAEAEGIKTSYKPVTGKINYPAVEKLLGVKLRGNESFDELLEIEKTVKESRQGIGSLFEKDISGFDDRGEVAEFVRKMRGSGIKNEDIRKIFKENPSYRKSRNLFSSDMVLDLGPGKRAATTLARAADMGADTPKKQELLSELDEMKMDEGPRFFQEEYMGFDDFNAAMDAKKIEVNNAIVDDLEKRGVDDEVISSIMGKAREINRNPFYISGEEFVDIIKEELEFEKISYDLDFYKKYFREIESLMRKPPSRFMYGGAV